MSKLQIKEATILKQNKISNKIIRDLEGCLMLNKNFKVKL